MLVVVVALIVAVSMAISGSLFEGQEVDDDEHACFGFEAFGQTLDCQWRVFEVVEAKIKKKHHKSVTSMGKQR